jgi:hypothetical protein
VIRSGVLKRLALLMGAAALSVGVGSCATLDQLMAAAGGVLAPPTITFRGASLVRSPSRRDLSAFYCPRLAKEQGLAFGGGLICSQFFGPAPAPDDLALGFDLNFQVANPNQIPLPLSEILTAITLFPGASSQNLGAVCMKLCAPGDAACHGGNDPRSCRQARGDIRTLNDFPQAVANMVLAEGVSAVAGQGVHFELPKVLAGSSLDVVARFSITPQAIIPIIEQLVRQSGTQLKSGQQLNLNVPYRLEGTVFADAGSLGRVAAGFGPTAGEWPVPLQRLRP